MKKPQRGIGSTKSTSRRAAADAFKTMSVYKGSQAQGPHPGGNPMFKEMQEAEKTLRAELLKFR